MKKLCAVLTLLIAGCATQDPSLNSYLKKKGISHTTTDRFQICRGYGCKFVEETTLTATEWKSIDKLFKPASKSAEQERERITKSIGAFETIVGEKTGTNEDIGGTFIKTGSYQQDCVDESTNTSIYLKLLQQRGHLKFHSVEPPTARFPIIHSGRWPHQSAAISNIETGELYAVDSWFHRNGVKAEIVALDQWKDGWKPEKRL